MDAKLQLLPLYKTLPGIGIIASAMFTLLLVVLKPKKAKITLGVGLFAGTAALGQILFVQGKIAPGWISYGISAMFLCAYLLFIHKPFIDTYDMRLKRRWIELFLLGIILIIGIYLRVADWKSQALGLWVDETWLGENAHLLMERGWSYTPVVRDRGSTAPYMMLPAIWLAGTGKLAIKFVPMVASILTLIFSYFLYRILFGTRLALLGSALMATGLWASIEADRLELEVNVPWLLALALFFWLRGIRYNRFYDYFIAGVLVIFGWTTFYPFQVAFGIMFLHLFYKLVFHARYFVRSWHSLPFFFIGAALMFYLIIIPHKRTFFPGGLTNPKQVFAYKDYKERISENLRKLAYTYNIKMFPTADIFKRDGPLLNRYLAMFFILGLAYCVFNLRREECFFLVSWFIVLGLPSIFSEPNPRRIVGHQGLVYIVIALGIFMVARSLAGLFEKSKTSSIVLTLLLAAMVIPAAADNIIYILKPSKQRHLSQTIQSTAIGEFIRDNYNSYKIYLMAAADIETVNYFAYGGSGRINTFSRYSFGRTFPLFDLLDKDIACILGYSPDGDINLRLLKQYFPNGRVEDIYTDGIKAFRSFTATVDDIERIRGLNLELLGSREQDAKPVASCQVRKGGFDAKEMATLCPDFASAVAYRLSGSFFYQPSSYSRVALRTNTKNPVLKVNGVVMQLRHDASGYRTRTYISWGANGLEVYGEMPDGDEPPFLSIEIQAPGYSEGLPATMLYSMMPYDNELRAVAIQPSVVKAHQLAPFKVDLGDDWEHKPQLRDLAIAPDGTIYAAEGVNIALLMLSEQGIIEHKMPVPEVYSTVLPASWPKNFFIYTAPDGSIYSPDFWNRKIVRIIPGEKVEVIFSRPGYEPIDLAVLDEDNLVSCGGKVIIWHHRKADGSWSHEPILDHRVLLAASAICPASARQAYCLDREKGSIYLLDTSGEISQQIKVEKLDCADIRMVADQNLIYLHAMGDNRVHIYTRQGTKLMNASGGSLRDPFQANLPGGIMALDIASDGRILAMGRHGHGAWFKIE